MVPVSPRTPERIRKIGLSLGFARVGFAPIEQELRHLGFFLDWLNADLCGEMDFLRRSAQLRGRPTELLPSARSAIVVLAHYGDGGATLAAELAPRPAGQVARFARGPDYHRVVAERLRLLAEQSDLLDAPALIAVDTLPLLERELAAAAGLGFIGKNTLFIAPGVGSYTCIGVLLTAHELPADPARREGCGRCRLCLDACPTGALREPYLLDGRRCVSALTIEQRGRFPEELLDRVRPWLFGCDRCQEVCPFNARRRSGLDPELARHSIAALDLAYLLELRSSAYRRLVRGRALRRASRLTLARNAAVLARGHVASSAELHAALEQAADSPDEGLRHAATWALRAASIRVQH